MDSKRTIQTFSHVDIECNDWNGWKIKDKKEFTNGQCVNNNVNDENINTDQNQKMNTIYPSFQHENKDAKLIESYKKFHFLKEIVQVKEDIIRFKSEMHGLAKQINRIESDLNVSKDKFYEIENRLLSTQELNVNLQLLLDKAIHKQKESDVYATRAVRHIHTNLAIVVYETGKLKGRLSEIAKYQKQHQGNGKDVIKKIREYTYMLEQADRMIHSLCVKPNATSIKITNGNKIKENSMNMNKSYHYNHHYHALSYYSSYNYNHHHHSKHGNNSSSTSNTNTNTTANTNKSELYRHRIIRRRTSDVSSSWLAQKGLKILLND